MDKKNEPLSADPQPEKKETEAPPEKIYVKNANAAGLGAMERDDEEMEDPDPRLSDY